MSLLMARWARYDEGGQADGGDEFLAHTFSLARYLSTASLTTHARDA